MMIYFLRKGRDFFMIDKITTFKVGKNDIDYLDGEIIKHASESFLPEGHIYDPDFLYMKVRAVSAGEYWGPNKNADFFPEAELVKTYKTFLEARAFKNHENKDIANAIGDVISATWNDVMKYVELLIRIDRQIAPTIVRGFEKGFMTDVSMGCKIAHSVCSKCGNIAKIPAQYCDHIKYHKHEVSDDGVRIYEINIGPRFHDISTVLSGADRTAKAVGLYIMGDKVAFFEPKEISKVASFAASLSIPAEEFGPGNPFYKAASATEISHFHLNGMDLVMDPSSSFSKVSGTKQGLMQKVADIKKEIQAKIFSVARGEQLKSENLDEIIELFKIFYTQFLSKEQCYEIADKINAIAERERVLSQDIFNNLVGMLEVAGIELSSIEFDRIISRLSGFEDGDIINSGDGVSPDSILDIKRESDNVIDEFGDESVGLPSALKLFSMLRRAKKIGMNVPLSDKLDMGDNMRVIVTRVSSSPKVMPWINSELFDSIRPLIPGRSMYRQHLIPRVIRAISSNQEPNVFAAGHFTGPRMLKAAAGDADLGDVASMFAYAQYQKLREKLAESGWVDEEFQKYAYDLDVDQVTSELDEIDQMEKTAILGKGYTVRKAVLLGAPIVFGYSAAQRARMRNGENVSDFNRFVAENPGSAFVLQAVLGPAAWKGLTKLKGKTFSGASNLGRKFKNSPPYHNTRKAWRESELYANIHNSGTFKKIKDFFTKKAEDNMYLLTKEASECFDHCDLIDGVDIFANPSIDYAMISKYALTQAKVETIKAAIILEAMEKSAASEDLLSRNSMTKSEISHFISECENYLSDEITKVANDATDVMMNTGNELLFAGHGKSMIPIMPGAVIDNLIFQGIFNALKRTGIKGRNKTEQVVDIGNKTIDAAKIPVPKVELPK